MFCSIRALPVLTHMRDITTKNTFAGVHAIVGYCWYFPVSKASFNRWLDAREAIAALALAPLVAPVVSAHVMGGCPIGPDVRRAAVDPTGRYHHLDNLYVLDGSLFPTSVGANPQLSIYAVTAKLASGLVARLGRSPG